MSQVKHKSKSAPTKTQGRKRGRGRGKGRGRGRNKARPQRRQALNRKPFYKRPSGGWVARELGSQRVFSTKQKAREALNKTKDKIIINEANLAQSLGGGVAGGYKCTPIIYKCTPCGYIHPPTKVKTLKPGISITDKNLNQEWSQSTQDHEGLPEWQCWEYNPEIHNITQEISCPITDIVMRTTWESGIQKMKIKLQKFEFGSGKHDQSKLSEIINFKTQEQKLTKMSHLQNISGVNQNQAKKKPQWPKTRHWTSSLKAQKTKHKNSR